MSGRDQPLSARWASNAGRLLVFLSLIPAAASAWISRDAMNADGIAYLGISDRILARDYSGAVTGYWSPLYPLILSAFRAILRPHRLQEFSVVHLANFAIYVAALGAFALFTHALIVRFSLPLRSRPLFLAYAYGVFVWAAVTQVTLSVVTPDLIVLLSVLLIAASVGPASDGSVRGQLALGVACGVAYLAKTVMFPGGILFLAAGFPRRRRWTFVLAVAAFIAISAPWIVAVSRSKGRVTYGDTGTIAYAAMVNGVDARLHWHGRPAGSGVPLHPTRIVSTDPPVYEFATPFPVTYPPWYDPSYWSDGIRPHFNVGEQKRALSASLQIYYAILVRDQWAFAGLLILLAACGWSRARHLLLLTWRTTLPSLAVLFLYALVHVEARLVAPFFVVILVGAFAAVSSEFPPYFAAVPSVVAISLFFVASATVLSQRNNITDAMNERRIAEGMTAAGLHEGDPIGSIGDIVGRSWPRLAGVRVVAEMPDRAVETFWSDRERRVHAVDSFRRAGAVAIAARRPPVWADRTGWSQPVRDSDTWLLRLKTE